MTETHFCPYEHPCKVSTDGHIYCPTCRECDTCGQADTHHQIGDDTFCSACGNSLPYVIATQWPNEEMLFQDGGYVENDDDLLSSGGSAEADDGQRIKLYDVYAYPIGVVKTPNVLAASPQAAIEAVYERMAWRECFASDGDGKNVEFVDFAEAFESFQVCEKGPDETSHLFLEDGVTRVNTGPLMALARFLAIAPEMCMLLDRLARSRDDADLAQVQQMLKGLLQEIAPQLLEQNSDGEQDAETAKE